MARVRGERDARITEVILPNEEVLNNPLYPGAPEELRSSLAKSLSCRNRFRGHVDSLAVVR